MSMHGLLFVLALAAGNEPKTATPPRTTTPKVASVPAVDRAVKKLDLSAERAAYTAAHAPRANLGTVPGYSAVITIEEQGLDLAPDYHAYQTLPLLGVGGRQGPSFDAHTGIPWWMY